MFSIVNQALREHYGGDYPLKCLQSSVGIQLVLKKLRIELTISELHRHPSSSRRDAEPVPPLWWDEIGKWPGTIRYLPEGPVAPIFQFKTREETEDLARFKALVLATMKRYLEDRKAEDVAFGPILEGEHSLNTLYNQGHPYLVKTFTVHQLGIPFPLWIQRRMTELTC